jgi:hypothetical protein
MIAEKPSAVNLPELAEAAEAALSHALDAIYDAIEPVRRYWIAAIGSRGDSEVQMAHCQIETAISAVQEEAGR